MNLRILISMLSLGVLTVSLSSPAFATLGEKADSVAKDRKALSAFKRVTKTTATDNYTVQEITSDANTIREYLTPSGVVFAVAWNGLTHPDFSTILGSYHSAYKKAKQSQPRQHRRGSRVVGDGVVVETWGHMRDMHGRAYLPTLVPTGVNLDEIR